ncbi:MAG: hypothetical protein ACI30A_07530 [Paludibacteraceae bacterium]
MEVAHLLPVRQIISLMLLCRKWRLLM